MVVKSRAIFLFLSLHLSADFSMSEEALKLALTKRETLLLVGPLFHCIKERQDNVYYTINVLQSFV